MIDYPAPLFAAADEPSVIAVLTLTALIIAGVIGVPTAAIMAWVRVVKPLDRMGKSWHRQSRFMVLDFVWLLVAIQVALGLLALAFRGDPQMLPAGVISGIAAAAVLAVCWWNAVGRLNRAGVNQVWKRAVYQVGVLPGLVLASAGLAAGALCLGLFAWAMLTPAQGDITPPPPLDSPWWFLALATAGAALAAGGYFGLAKTVQWVVEGAEEAENSSDLFLKLARQANQAQDGASPPAGPPPPHFSAKLGGAPVEEPIVAEAYDDEPSSDS